MSVLRFVKVDNTGADLPKVVPPHVAVKDLGRGLMWGPTLDRKMDFEEAKKACAECRLLGFSDWRLPTVEELFLLADRSRTEPAIDMDLFPDTKSDWYWTSSPWADSPASLAWFVGFGYGSAYNDLHDSKAFVRPVRSLAASGQ
jgi:hypothetical protein